MADARRRVAMLGAGLASAPYLTALPALGAEVVAVATRDEQRFAAVSDVFPGTARCWPPEDVFDHGPLDAVLVLSPAHRHLSSVRLCADHGVPVVLEKPVETTLARARELQGVASESGLPVAVVFQYRYRAAAQELHQALTRGDLGVIQAASLDVSWWRTQAYFDEPGRGTYDRDGGGVLITQAIHSLDLLVWYLGLPRAVTAIVGRGKFHRLEAEDVAASLLRYAGGAMASVFATTGARGPDRMVLRLFGDKAMAELTETSLVLRRDPLDTSSFQEPSHSYEGSHPMAFTGEWHRALLADSFDAFESGREPMVGLEDGIRILELIDAIERSGTAAAWIEIPQAKQSRDIGKEYTDG